MTSAGRGGDRPAKWIRWIARGAGSLVAAFWLLMGIGYGTLDPPSWTLEDVVMTVLIISSALGILIAWWREGIGGVVVLVCAVAHSTFALIAAGHNKGLALLVSGGPFFIIGALFLVAWWRSRGAQQGAGAGGAGPS